MASTDLTQAIEIANNIIGAAQQTMAVYAQLKQSAQHWTDVDTGAVLDAMATIAENPDGSLGTPDSAPVNGNPIDVQKYPTLSRALSALEITQIKSILDGFVGYIDGQAVTTQPGAHAILNKAVGG